MSGWFKRIKEGITTSTREKKETPEGLWYSCPKCKAVTSSEEHKENLSVCVQCDHHERISAEDYFAILFDDGSVDEFATEIESGDPLKFEDTKKYSERVKATQKKTGLKDAIRTAYGEVDGWPLVVAAMDFKFIGGSMGSVVGEKIAMAIDEAITRKCPFMIISKSGGARMMEAGYSLMQMAKTSAKLRQLSDAGLPYFSFLTDPTTGGVTASFAMLGDLNFAEPGALIGFAGPRVVKETIGRDLPKGFQRSEFVLEHGFLDFIVHRKELRQRIAQLIEMLEK
ncbi:MAG: acetyl-CoA carboxylase carboxyltransferase subunit beta [Flavobacteriales bacterium]|nr:acetyl-CoA carboxylase carboxyltransferase subunit beta [Flavobacteriales bacterium]